MNRPLSTPSEPEKCGNVSLYSTAGVNDWRCDLPKGHDGVHIAFASYATMSWGNGDDPCYGALPTLRVPLPVRRR